MRATPLRAKSFLARSLDELKRRSSIAWNLDAVKGPAGPRELYDFDSADAVKVCITMSDASIGGASSSQLDFVPASPAAYARFHGRISTLLPPNRLAIERTGYAAFRTPDQSPTVFGRSVWDIDPYTYLALRVKSDGRAYYVNVQTESVEPTDLHQHRLFSKRPGQWETILIRWNDFVRTNHGFVVEPQTEILRQKVYSVGIGLTDRVEGPFELCIARVWATNGEEGNESEDYDGELKNRKGEPIQWP
ncbi:complex I intermediate-associated protein 30 domain-containing protein [Trichoderma austrokoningii]